MIVSKNTHLEVDFLLKITIIHEDANESVYGMDWLATVWTSKQGVESFWTDPEQFPENCSRMVLECECGWAHYQVASTFQ